MKRQRKERKAAVIPVKPFGTQGTGTSPKGGASFLGSVVIVSNTTVTSSRFSGAHLHPSAASPYSLTPCSALAAARLRQQAASPPIDGVTNLFPDLSKIHRSASHCVPVSIKKILCEWDTKDEHLHQRGVRLRAHCRFLTYTVRPVSTLSPRTATPV